MRRAATELILLFYAAFKLVAVADAQAGPPYLTNDPGTPGNLQWEINIATMFTNMHGVSNYQLPQLDLNFGLGERIQLSYEAPYVVQTEDGEVKHSGWSNASPGVKWRFLDQGEEGWQASIFPQVEVTAPAASRRSGIGESGPRYLLPIQAARKFGPVDLDAEAGYFLPRDGLSERILGIVAGHSFATNLELDVELYDDRVSGGISHNTTLDGGGRYRFSRNLLALLMIGHGLNGAAGDRIQFMGYAGVQILIH